VRIIDVEQRGGQATVWSAVHAAGTRRSFECRYNDRVRSFKLLEIPAKR
jgi:hypothetical protein